jgi:hypothetical protein
MIGSLEPGNCYREARNHLGGLGRCVREVIVFHSHEPVRTIFCCALPHAYE